MKRFLLCLLLGALALSHAVLLNSCSSTTKIASLAPRRLVGLAPYHEANSCDHFGNGAKWIWNAQTDRSSDGYTEIFETVFTPQCTNGVVNLQITADNEFVAYLNGAKVGEGKNWREKFNFALNLLSGANTLRIVVVNRDCDSPAGLIFAVTQTQNGQIRTLTISGDGKTYIVTPPVLVEPYHTANQPNFLCNGAQWVWESRLEAVNEGFTSLFEKTFQASCAGLTELLITADNEFTVYLNGVFIGSGKDWTKKYQFQLGVKVGSNTLRIVVINRGQGTPGGLIFSVTQIEGGVSKVLAVSDATLSIVSGLVSYEPYHNYNQPNYLGNGANWIWDTRVGNLDEGYTVIFQNVFQATCSAASTLTITADNEFAVYLNGIKIGTGNDWVHKYCFPLNLQVGSNVLEIVVVNRGQGTPGGLIFTVVQGGQVLAISDPSTTTISPNVGIENYHTANQADFLGTGAQWIWNNLGDDWPEGYSETFRSNFRGEYTSQAALLITADNEFVAFLNGVFVGTGNNWRKSYQFQVSLLCGQNELVVVVLNHDKGSPAALIFSVVQDQSAVGCKCDAAASCTALEVFNPQTCSCQCGRIACPAGQQLDQSTCRCNLCRPVACKLGAKWDQSQCACVPICVQTLFCIATKVFDPVRCACVCPAVQSCSSPSYWDESICSCTFVLDPPALPVLPLPPVKPLQPVNPPTPLPQPFPYFPVKPLPQPLPVKPLPYIDQPISLPVQPFAPC